MEILRQEYLDYLTCRAVKRPLFVELFGPLVGLEEEWRAQGAREDELDLTAFGFDYVRRHTVAVNTSLLGGEEQLLEDTPDYTIQRDAYGRRLKLYKRSATIGHPIEYPVHDRNSWRAIKPRYILSEARLAGL